ncbi:hypothetical protein BD413DRAFT_468146 [Trametes elegans]|nr:hypothetical protein BD413DRAFT_468146 [Trametes elegans]
MENTRALPPTTPKKVLAAIHNIPRRMRSGTLRTQPPTHALPPQPQPQPPRAGTTTTTRHRALGKENTPPVPVAGPPPRRRRPAPLLPKSSLHERERWAPRAGQMVIKVWVPTTDDIWKVRVPAAGVGLAAFRARVAAKVGFEVAFSAVVDGHLRTLADEDAFRRWVAGRVRGGRNTLLTAHRLVLQ